MGWGQFIWVIEDTVALGLKFSPANIIPTVPHAHPRHFLILANDNTGAKIENEMVFRIIPHDTNVIPDGNQRAETFCIVYQKIRIF
jgi:hypothetical protein